MLDRDAVFWVFTEILGSSDLSSLNAVILIFVKVAKDSNYNNTIVKMVSHNHCLYTAGAAWLSHLGGMKVSSKGRILEQY